MTTTDTMTPPADSQRPAGTDPREDDLLDVDQTPEVDA